MPPELKVVLEEQNQRVANNPGARLGEQIEAALYLNHPYGRPVIGWRHEIEKLNREDALAFYKRFYTPNNAVLVVAGDVTADEVKALAEATYGKVAPTTEIGPRKRPQEPAQVAPRAGHAGRSARRAAQPAALLSGARPPPTAKPGEAEALEVLAHILGNGSTGRLYRTLVMERELAVSAGGWYSGSALDATRFGVYGSPKPGVTLQQLEAGDRRGDRRGRRQGRHRGRDRTREEPADRRRGLSPRTTRRRWRAGTAWRSPPARRSSGATAGPTASAP